MKTDKTGRRVANEEVLKTVQYFLKDNGRAQLIVKGITEEKTVIVKP